MDSESLYAAALDKARADLQRLASAEEKEPISGVPSPPTEIDQPKVPRAFDRSPSLRDNAEEQSPGIDVPGSLTGFPPTFPSHKRLPGTRFVVDGFRVAGAWSHSYFLTHFHSDHYQGITDNWRKGVIFCSETTARMVVQVLEVPPHFVVPLPMDREVEIDGCGVTLIDANHCPGAIQFLFRIPGAPEKRYVHCGDMRFCTQMTANPCLAPYVGADAVYLDTTYCNPRYVFPLQEASVEYIAATVAARMQEWRAEYDAWIKEQPNSGAAAETNPAGDGEGVGSGDPPEGEASPLERVLAQPVDSTDCPRPPLFIIATYVIGKEKILYAVAHRCGCKIYVDERKIKILRCLGLNDLSIFTNDSSKTNVHVVGWGFLGDAWPFFRANFTNMEQALDERGYEKAVGFVPTGWTYELKKKAFPTREKGRCKIHLVPYSEHSNYAELREYVSFLKPKQIIPTVGVDEKGMDGKAVAAMRKHFRNLVDETEGKRRFLRSFQRSGSGSKPPALELAAELAVDVVDEDTCQNPVERDDTCQDLTVKDEDGLDESDEAEEEVQAKDDPDYVDSEADVSRSEGDVSGEEGETGKGRGRPKRGSKLKGGEKAEKDPLLVAEKKDPLPGRLTPVLNRRGKRKFDGEKSKGNAPKRTTLEIKPKVKEAVKAEVKIEAAEDEPERKEDVANGDLGKGSGEGLSWIQAHKQALQGVDPPVNTVGPNAGAERKVEEKGVKEETLEHAQESQRESEGEGNGSLEKVEQLRAILPGMTAAKAELLLARAGGDVAGAVTWFYDGGCAEEVTANHAEGGPAEDLKEGRTDAERNGGEEDRNVKQAELRREHEEEGERQDAGADVAADAVADAGVDVIQGATGDEADEGPSVLQTADRRDRTSEASPSPKGGGAPQPAAGKTRTPPRTPVSARKRVASQVAGKRASASKAGGGAAKKGKTDRQQPSILSFFGGGKKEQPSMGAKGLSGAKTNGMESGHTKEGGDKFGGKHPEAREAGERTESDGEGAASLEANVGQLLGLLDGGLGKEEAEALLKEAEGDVNRALDLFYSREGPVTGGGDSKAHASGERDGVATGPQEAKGGACSTEEGALAEKSPEEVDPPKEKEEDGVSKHVARAETPRDGDLGSQLNGKQQSQEVRQSQEARQTQNSEHSKEGGEKEEVAEEKGGANGAKEVEKGNKVLPSERQLGGVVATGKLGASESERTAVTLSLAKYDPIGHACWTRGEAAPYLHLARTFEILERERGRLKMADILCNMFRSLLALSPDDILPAVYLSTNRVAPDFENVDMSIGGSTVGAAIAEATGTSKAQMRELYNSLGDLGDVALACKQRQATLMAPPPLRVAQVYRALRKISKETGPGCNNRKKNIVLGLLRACREKETQFVVRTLILNMRIGAMMKTVLPALAQAVVIHKSLPSDAPAGPAINGLKSKLQEASAAVVEAYNFCPNLDVLVPTLVEGGIEAVIAQGAVALGTPIKPMLAKITNGIPEVLKRFQSQAFTAEFKYDGQRAQIHLLPDGTVRIFSRNCDDNTAKFPDVIATVKQAARGGCSSFIIDAELVAVDRSAGNKLMAFQTLSTRARGGEKTKIELADVKIAVCVFAFDLMFVDGQALVKESFRERRRRMHAAFPKHSAGHFEFAREATVEEPESDPELEATSSLLQTFLQDAFAASCEGIMVKALDKDAGYAASKRSDSWLKVKKDYIEGLNDSLDLVPIGAWYGQGRKVGWFSPFLLGCYDPDREEYQSVCRCMSGFTDVFYKETTQLYREQRQLDQKPPYYRTLEQPDVWFRPHDVWEIRGADLTVSPVHAAAAGLVHPTRGISMRFPRMIKTRPDKKPEDSTPPSYIAELFHRQTRKLDVGLANGKDQKVSVQGGAGPAAEVGGEKEESGEESGEEEDGQKRPVVGLDD